jgi:uroporphyrinogen decarboxylase
MFKRFFDIAYRRALDHFRRGGAEVILVDSDGHVGELIPLWIDLGVDGTFPVEVAANNDPVEIRKSYGPSFAMIGGIDKREIAKGEGEVDREVDRKVPFLLASGGYIPTIDHAISPDIPLSNYLRLRQRIRRYAEGA